MALATLTIDLVARMATLEKDLGRAAHLAEKTAGKMSSAFAAMRSVMGPLAVAGAGIKFAEMLKSSIDAADQLDKLAQKTGTTVEALAGLKYAADQNDTSLQSVAEASKKLAVNLNATPELFKKLGIESKDTTGAMIELADVFQSMPDGAQKTALAVKLMGKSGEEMIPLLNNGSAALREMVQVGQKLNPVTSESARQAGEFNDNLATVKASIDGIATGIANQLLPGLAKSSGEMAKLAAEGKFLDAILVGLGASMKLPWDLLFPPADLKKELGVDSRLKDLRVELGDLQRHMKSSEGGGLLWKWMYGTKDEMLQRQRVLENSIATIEKHRAEIEKPAPEPEKKKGFDASSILLENQRKAEEQLRQRGDSILRGLSGDYLADIEKKMRELNAPLMSENDKKHADNLAAVTQRADRAREALDQLKLSESSRAVLLGEVTAIEAAQIAKMEELRIQVEKNNASWEYGAQVALQKYLDEARNVAKQTESMFTNAFKGMEDALVNFVKTGKLDFTSMADSIITDLIRIQIRQAMMTGITGLGGLFKTSYGTNYGSEQTSMLNQQWDPSWGTFPSAKGNVFGSGGIQAFALGGAFSNSIVNKPTLFPFANGTGLMGEAGPEAIMPLKRGADGRLGVTVTGGTGGGATVIVNVDASGQSQSGDNDSNLNQLGQKIGTLVRGIMLDEMRPGGLLAGNS